MESHQIIQKLPYQKPFLFVDAITSVSENRIIGEYTFDENLSFYKGHFVDNPITPGVILIECMAQIGLVCFGIYLLNESINKEQNPKIAFTSSQVDFFKPVYPGEKVKVVSKKEVFRFNKLKCKVSLFNEKEELVCRGKLSGMLTS